MATTSIWSVKGWLGKVVIYVENPDKTMNPEIAKLPELSGMGEKETQGLSDVIAYAVNAEKTRQRGKAEAKENIVATRFCRPIINPVACHGINRYNDMRTEKGKGSRTPAFSREPCSETTIKTMIIISKYEVEYKEEEDIFHQQ